MKHSGNIPYPYIIDTLDTFYGVNNKSDVQKYSSFQPSKKLKLTAKQGSQKRRLSILITTFWDYPHTGGLSNYISELSATLRSQGHYVDVISPRKFPSFKKEEMRNEIVPELEDFFSTRYGEVNNLILKNHRLLYIYEQMLKTVDLERYDILHAQDLFTANILGNFNKSLQKPLFYTPHGMYTFNRLKFNIFDKGSVEEAYYLRMEQQAVSFASHIIILHDGFRSPLESIGAKQEHMTTVYTGIKNKMYAKKRKEKDQKITIASIARLGPRKGHKDLLKALSTINHQLDNVEVLIVGDGEMREELEEQKEQLNLDMVHFLRTRTDVPEILHETDIFVLATLNDSLPLSIIEAMHAETAIISTECGGIPEIVKHNKTGIIIEPGDTETLARALSFFITNKKARERMATNAKHFAKAKLTNEKMVSFINNLYVQGLAAFKVGEKI
ncbi:glycosyltransferase family 4 protein [Priestia sp. GS2]|uniref:glycosyltransferase family 4 protein n=1 Tax=Priestia sp. GS2 TaxID=3117403 RepID=UPI002ED79A04